MSIDATTLATRIYTKKRFGAHPEVDNHIIYDRTATKPEQRYLANDTFCKNLAEARGIIIEALKVPFDNQVTEVHYVPPVGWQHTSKGKSTAITQGADMTKTIPTEPRTRSPNKFRRGQEPKGAPKGPYAQALRELATFEAMAIPVTTAARDNHEAERIRIKKRVSVARISQLEQEQLAQQAKAVAREVNKRERQLKQKDAAPQPAPVVKEEPSAAKRFTINIQGARNKTAISVDVYNYEDLDHLMGSIKKHNF